MASRRSRIKVLANIPLRRKTAERSTEATSSSNGESVLDAKIPKLEEPEVKLKEVLPSVSKEDNVKTLVDLNPSVKLDPEELNFPEDRKVVESTDTAVKLDGKSLTILNEDIPKCVTYVELNPSDEHQLNESDVPVGKAVIEPEQPVVKIEEKPVPILNDIVQGVTYLPSEDVCSDVPTDRDSKTLPVRRKFLKPVISMKALVKRPRTVREDNVQSDSETPESRSEEQKPSSPIHPLNLESINLGKLGAAARKIEFEDKMQPRNSAEMTLDEIVLSPQVPVLPQDNFIQKIPKDLEYPPPPPSPNIINRIRKRAVPRLSNRKTSVSASESEDETRKGGARIRNDSVCSLSYPDPSPSELLTPSKTREINSVIQKKCSRTEQTRKLAEAKMEFQKRFGEDKPDRQKLTMMDLIFYNPSSNPMIKDPTTSSVQAPVEHNEKSDAIDDPDPVDSRSDEENEAPVPQIKLGPTGEIIVDEKSLVVEQKQIKRQKKRLQNTEIIDGDKDAASYGLYKRQKRGKNWTKDETLRFYKALNILGTDFGLMCDLFPNRTRKQLKMKFKKEEKINKHLVDRAVTRPNDFSYSDLKYEVEAEQREFEELEKMKREERAKREMKKRHADKEKKEADKEKKDAEATNEDDATPESPLDLSIFPPQKKRRNRRSKAATKRRRRSVGAESSNSDADVSDLETQSESEADSNLKLNLKPTRYGRMPRPNSKLIGYDEEPPRREKLTAREEGSLMVLSQEEAEKSVYRVFLITANNREVENLLTITAREITEDEDEPIVENNVTIPADETVSNLRTKFPEGDAVQVDTRDLACMRACETTSPMEGVSSMKG